MFTKNADYAAQLVEHILPFFTPEWTTTLKLIPELDIRMDVPTVLQSVSIEDAYEGDFDTRRSIIYNLDFVVKGYIYGPVRNQGIINRARIVLHDGLDNDNATAVVTTQPAQFANGVATTNADASVAYTSIAANSDFGFSNSIDESNQFTTLDPVTGNFDD